MAAFSKSAVLRLRRLKIAVTTSRTILSMISGREFDSRLVQVRSSMTKVKRVEQPRKAINAKDVKKPRYPVQESFSCILGQALIRHGVKFTNQ